MAKRPDAGSLKGLFSFQKRGDGDDGFGGPPVPGTGTMAEVFKDYGRLIPLVGSETVIAGRLAGRQPYRLTVRSNTNTRTIDPSWQIVDVRAPTKIYAILSPVSDSDMGNEWLDMLIAVGPVA